MRVLGTRSLKQFLFDDLEELVLPADFLIDPANSDVEAPQDARFHVSKMMDAFVTKAAEVSLAKFSGMADAAERRSAS